MHYKNDYIWVDPDTGRSYVYYDEAGQIYSFHVPTKSDDRRVEVLRPDEVPNVFPFALVGPHFIQNGLIADFRIKAYEYTIDLTAKPPALVRRDYLQNLEHFKVIFDGVKASVLEHLKNAYTQIASKSDNVAMEYYKKSLLPEYALKVDTASVALLKKYPEVTKKYKELKAWVTELKVEALNDVDKGKEIVDKLLKVLSEDVLNQ